MSMRFKFDEVKKKIIISNENAILAEIDFQNSANEFIILKRVIEALETKKSQKNLQLEFVNDELLNMDNCMQKENVLNFLKKLNHKAIPISFVISVFWLALNYYGVCPMIFDKMGSIFVLHLWGVMVDKVMSIFLSCGDPKPIVFNKFSFLSSDFYKKI